MPQIASDYGVVYRVLAVFDHGSTSNPTAHIYRAKTNLYVFPDTILGAPCDSYVFFVTQSYLDIDAQFGSVTIADDINDALLSHLVRSQQILPFLLSQLTLSAPRQASTQPPFL